jgi:hypothetical protein
MEKDMYTPLINHRRDRHQSRRILADLLVRYRDLSRSSFMEIDPVNDHLHGVFVYPRVAFTGGRH